MIKRGCISGCKYHDIPEMDKSNCVFFNDHCRIVVQCTQCKQLFTFKITLGQEAVFFDVTTDSDTEHIHLDSLKCDLVEVDSRGNEK